MASTRYQAGGDNRLSQDEGDHMAINPHTIRTAELDGLPTLTGEMTVRELDDVHGLPIAIVVDGPGVYLHVGRGLAVLTPKDADIIAAALLAASCVARNDIDPDEAS
jgi:hypothetical protein